MPRELFKPCYFKLSLLALIWLLTSTWALAQSAAFTYQGRLTDAGNPADELYNMQFKLFDTATVGTGIQQGSTITDSAVQVTNGTFTVQLDFGVGVFNGDARFLEVGIRPAGSPDPFTLLSPRHPVTSTPYALRSATAGTADTATNATQLGGMASSGFIQNTTAQQSATSFNIGGTGAANILSAATQFNLNGQRILSNAGTDNLLAGIGAGAANTGFFNSFFGFNAGLNNETGSGNSFFGRSAGQANTTACCNSFFGRSAGEFNTGSNNSFFGNGAGQANTTAGGNSFFGTSAGQANTTGDANSFFGRSAGEFNTTGRENSFFGTSAGRANTTGVTNSFFGRSAGQANTTGGNNSYFGKSAGQANTTGSDNSFFGALSGISNTGSENAFFGTSAGQANTTGNRNSFFGMQAGFSNTTGSDNSFFGINAGVANTTGGTNSFFGSFAGQANTTGNRNSFFGTQAGSANTTGINNSFFGSLAGQLNTGGGNSFFGTSAGQINTTGFNNSFFGASAGFNNATGSQNSFFGLIAGLSNTTGERNTFIGDSSGSSNTTGSNNTFIGATTGNPDAATQVNNSTAIGFGARVSTSNTIVIGRTTETTRIPGKLVTSKLIMGGGPVESGGVAQTFDTGTIQGIFAANLVLFDINDILASPVHLCIRSTSLGGFGGEALARCTSSSSPSQYKTDLQPFLSGLGVINRLKPMTFTWKNGGKRDFGLNAEDVAEVEPLLVTRNDKGEVEDVNEASFNVLFINAFKEQQQQIKLLQQQIEILKKIICMDHPEAVACK